MTTTHKPQIKFMAAAIEEVTKHLSLNEGGPFGACIVIDEKIIALSHNTVLKASDPTCHAEINAIRIAAKKLASHDLSGCTIYSTTEPCPMCFSAIHWANIEEIVYGTEIADVNKLGFHELTISNQTLKSLGESSVRIVPGFQRESCLNLLKDWQAQSAQVTY